MGFREGAFATVWEITDERDNFAKIRISTSRKDKKTDEYVTDFSGFVSLVGDAFKNLDVIARELEENERCRIKIGACDVSNRYDKDKEREFVNFTMFSFEIPEGKQSDDSDKSSGKKTAKKTSKSTAKGAGKKKAAPPPLEDDDDDGDEDLPF